MLYDVAIWVSQVDPRHPLKAIRYSRGAVIDALPAGWKFGPDDLNHSDWRIVRMEVDSLDDLLKPVFDRDGILMLAKRARVIDLDTVPQVEAKLRRGEIAQLSASDVEAVLAAKVDVEAGAAVIG